MSLPKHFDYIITGAGCAGLSLAMHLIESGKFSDKKILLVDKDSKKQNDRTWCFWEKESGLFESIVYRQWEQIWFHGEDFSKKLETTPYRYKMIRGADFYAYCLAVIRQHKNFFIWKEEVEHVFSTRRATGVVIGGRAYLCDYVFNSILFQQPKLGKRHYWLLQHFKGWVVETEEDHFDPAVATLMDFSISQEEGTAFCYVLPSSRRTALVEYTLFTGSLLPKEKYDEGLRAYLEQIGIQRYTITEEEFGVIPMTNYPFQRRVRNLINLGTAGGQTKGSSGYTFRYIQKHSQAIVEALVKKGRPSVRKDSIRYAFYDSVLLHILHHNTLPGKLIFTELFKKNTPSTVFRFLDNETSLAEEIKILSTLPTLPFLKAAMRHLAHPAHPPALPGGKGAQTEQS